MYLMNCTRNNLENCSLKRMHYLMGTFLRIEIFHHSEDEAGEIIELAFSEVRRIERLLSRYREDSQVYKINNLAHIQPQVIDEELFFLIEECLGFSKHSDSAFDITVGSLIDLWSQAEKDDFLPTQGEINSLLLNSGYQNIIFDKETRTIFFKTPLLKTDFGALGKGYALDRMAKVLKENGIKKARLDFGGQLYYFGQTELDKDYIGIKNPSFSEKVILCLWLENKSISTSANYERNFHINNKIYSHIINPITGYPVDNHILSVSVISNSALLADIYSTAIYILGLEKGLRLIENIDNTEAVIITDDYGEPKVNVSERLREVVLKL